jgi:putative acetyltransferase
MAESLHGGESYPTALDPERVGTYPATSFAGGGYVWDAVLEYRVWCHPERGAPDDAGGSDYYHAFRSYEEALEHSVSNPGTEAPLALVLQREYIDEPEPGQYRHVRDERITEWPVEFLRRPRRDRDTLAKFFAPDAPANRLDIIRGLAEWPD